MGCMHLPSVTCENCRPYKMERPVHVVPYTPKTPDDIAQRAYERGFRDGFKAGQESASDV